MRGTIPLPMLAALVLMLDLASACSDAPAAPARGITTPASTVATDGMGSRTDITSRTGGPSTSTITPAISDTMISSTPAFSITQLGPGDAGKFLRMSTGVGEALLAQALGTGLAFHAHSVSGTAAQFTSGNGSPVVSIIPGGSAIGLQVGSLFSGTALKTTSNGSVPTVDITQNGPGFAATVTATNALGSGLMITAPSGRPGLQVVGGTKNAVVGTPTGARELYTEESSEVWFSDYGLGRVASGVAHVAIDRTFAQTVSLKEPYHVFVQSYGDADLVVLHRTPQGFDVVRRGAGEDAPFSYRIVAKRLGFETKRLERAPWADSATRRF